MANRSTELDGIADALAQQGVDIAALGLGWLAARLAPVAPSVPAPPAAVAPRSVPAPPPATTPQMAPPPATTPQMAPPPVTPPPATAPQAAPPAVMTARAAVVPKPAPPTTAPLPPKPAPVRSATGRVPANRVPANRVPAPSVQQSAPLVVPPEPPSTPITSAPPAPAMSPRWRRGARAILLGMLQPGAAEAVERERLLSARVRARRREPRVVAFVAGKGGVGTTTLAAGVALTLAALRHDDTTIVDPRYGTPSLGQRIAGQPAPTVAQFASGGDAARTRGRLGIVDPAPWRAPIWHGDLMRALDQLREGNAFTIVDLGTDVSENGTAVLGRADHTVVVTAPTGDAIEATRLALLRVRHIEPTRYGALMVAVVCLNNRQYRSIRQLLKQAANALGIPVERVMAVPFDPVLATGVELAPDSLHPATREAFLYLAGIIAEGAGVSTPAPVSAVSRPILVGGRQ